MAYIYCRECDVGLEEPTLEVKINGYDSCRNCGHTYNCRPTDEEIFLELLERITALEGKLYGIGDN